MRFRVITRVKGVFLYFYVHFMSGIARSDVCARVDTGVGFQARHGLISSDSLGMTACDCVLHIDRPLRADLVEFPSW